MRRTRAQTSVLTLAAAVFFAACSDSPQSLTPIDADSPVAPNVLAGARGQEELVRQIPGFGGVFLDENGTPNVYLTDLDAALDAELDLASFMRDRGFDAVPIKVRRADFTIPQLDEWFTAAAEATLGHDGVVTIDIDDRSNRVSIGVVDASQVEMIRDRAVGLGIPVEALDVTVMGPIRTAATLQDQVRPVQGGLQINFDLFVCTLGFNVAAVNGRESPSFITNSHCTDVQGGTEGTRYFQPAFFVPEAFIGLEVDDPTYDSRECFEGFVCRYSDAARVRYDGGVSHTLGKIYRTTGPNNLDLTIDGEWKLVAKRRAMVGHTVSKVGRTTGWSEGEVFMTGVAVLQAGSNIVVLDQSFANGFVGGGDSGSPVVFTDEDHAALTGLLWGGAANGSFYVFSTIQNVQMELGRLKVK